MEQKKINQLNAAKTTVAYCEATASETASNTNFAPKVAFIKGRIVLVEGFNQLSDAPITGIRLNVNGIRAQAIEEVLPLASAVFAYAGSLTPVDNDLMAKSKVTKTQLEAMSKENCATECQRLVTLAQDNAANILSYGITGTMISDAQTTVTLYGNVINDPRAAAISKASAGEQAETILSQIMNFDLAKQLDPMANIFRFTKNVWYKSYKKSREIIDLGTTFTKLRVDAVNKDDNPLKNVKVTMRQGGEEKYSTKTDAAGSAHIVKVKPGNYDIYFELNGFSTQIEADYHFAPGSEKIHHIVLLANPGTDPAGFNIQEFHIPAGGSVLAPFSSPTNPLPGNTEIFLLCTNGLAIVCTTDLPANPCTAGYQLLQNVVYNGVVSGLGLDLMKTNIQFTNPGTADITVRAGVKS